MHPNHRAQTLCDHAVSQAESLRIGTSEVGGARLLDFGVLQRGGLAAGTLLARICLADLADVSLQTASQTLLEQTGCGTVVNVATDHPLLACLGGQYAGWPVQSGKFFAMGSGPMRMARGKEAMLEEFQLLEKQPGDIVGVLESDKLPDAVVIDEVASQCGVEPTSITLCVAAVTSIAGSVQVVARSVETALHKMHAVGLDPRNVISAFGTAPLPPMATEMVSGIGRTNDAILYGAAVTLWVDEDQNKINSLGEQVPSCSSKDYGKPFAETFKSYNYDFYKVDPNLFSPAVVSFVNVRTGLIRTFGGFEHQILRQSFGYVDVIQQPPPF